MNYFQPHINVTYPPNNFIIFEEWFGEVYKGCNTDRELLPVNFTSYWVNNNYGNNADAKNYLQSFIDGLDREKKYFCIVQYDDGVLIDFKDLDVLQFNMSKKVGVEIPLLCQPHPYTFTSEKKYLASFVGSRTHPIRNELDKLKGDDRFYISFEPHPIEEYCKILHESIFSLCPRGYGLNSFRISEALQYNSIPVYFSNEFIIPFSDGGNLPDWMLLINSDYVDDLKSQVCMLPNTYIVSLQNKGKDAYVKYYTYNGCFKKIIESIETEYNSRKNVFPFSANGKGARAAANI